MDNKYVDKCVIETPTNIHIDQQIISSPDDTSSTQADNTTTQEVQESCSSPWSWIAVAILFMLLTLPLYR